MKLVRHYDPLRPHRMLGESEKYEFTHGTGSVCVYDLQTMAFVKEIQVGARPDCHSTSLDNRFLYIASQDGLYCIEQASLRVVKRVNTGRHVYGTNVMPDGTTMLLHDMCGGILVLKDIQSMARIRIHKRLDVLGERVLDPSRIAEGLYALGGKGNFMDDGRYYLCNSWRQNGNIYRIDIENDCAFETFIANDPQLVQGDDLVVSADKRKAYSACYNRDGLDSYVAVIDLQSKQTIKRLKTGTGTCGLTMSNDERYVIASNNRDDSLSVIDSTIDEVVSTVSARAGFERLGIPGYIQGVSVGQQDEIYVYGCAGNGALVRFEHIAGASEWTISYPGGKCSGKGVQR